MENIPEPELLRMVRALDRAAIIAVYDRYSPGIYRYALRLTGSEEQAEDCVAETFNRFLAALHARRGPQDYLQAYLYRIAHNWINDLYRRSPNLVALEEDVQDVEGQGQLVQSVDSRLLQQRVRQALAQLNEDQRQVVALRYLEGWEIDEIARSLQKAPAAVRAVLHRAVVNLRSLLHGED